MTVLCFGANCFASSEVTIGIGGRHEKAEHDDCDV